MLIEIFVPDKDFLSEKINTIKSRFAFFESIMNTIEIFNEFFKTDFSEPPKIEINLDAAESIYDFGDKAYALDMTWYARYKPAVDSITSSIMWVFFCWRTYFALPKIITGTGSDLAEAGGADISKRSKKW